MPTSKPTNIDAQRILSIMDELKEKLYYLSVVTAQVLDRLQGDEEGQAASEQLGPDLIRQFSEQIRLEDLYMVANTAADGTFGQAEDTEDVREDEKSLTKNTLELCRKMKTFPTIVQDLGVFQDTRPNAVIQFLKTLADMQELTLKRLTTTVEEEKSRAELLDYYLNRENEATNRRQQLEKDLAFIRSECEKEQLRRNEVLTKLRADLLDVRLSKEQMMSALRTRYENRMKEQHEYFNQTKEDLEKRIAALKEQLKTTKGASNEDEVGKKKTVKRYEMEVEAVIKQYDSEVKRMASTLYDHHELQKKEQKQLTELQEHFEKVDTEKDHILNEEAIVAARSAKKNENLSRKNDAAALVQAFFKGITLREAFKIEQKKRKKGGKGGKKKK